MYASQCVCMRYPNCLKPSAQQQRHFGQSCDTTKYDRAAHDYNHDEACRCNSAFCSKGHGCTLPGTTPQTCHKRQCPYDAMLLIQIKNLAASMYVQFILATQVNHLCIQETRLLHATKTNLLHTQDCCNDKRGCQRRIPCISASMQLFYVQLYAPPPVRRRPSLM